MPPKKLSDVDLFYLHEHDDDVETKAANLGITKNRAQKLITEYRVTKAAKEAKEEPQPEVGKAIDEPQAPMHRVATEASSSEVDNYFGYGPHATGKKYIRSKDANCIHEPQGPNYKPR